MDLIELFQRVTDWLSKEPSEDDVMAQIEYAQEGIEICEALGIANTGNTPKEQEVGEPYAFEDGKSKAQRQADNDAAIEILDKVNLGEIKAEELTEEQKTTLSKYSGNGGGLIGRDGKVGSAHEYYTPAPVAEAVWDVVQGLGFEAGKVLDPCAGTGIFGAKAPASVVVHSVEMDETSGQINGLVNPGHQVTVSSFEEAVGGIEDNSVDAVVTNVPFGQVTSRKHRHKDTKYRSENMQSYFVLRSLDKLKHGGLAAFIVPASFLDGKGAKEQRVRSATSLKAEFLGAYRLPNSVFGTAGADVATDVIFFRKHSKSQTEKIAELQAQNPELLVSSNVLWDVYIDGLYFKQSANKKFILGEEGEREDWRTTKDGQKKKVYAVINNDSVANISKAIQRFTGGHIDWKAIDAFDTDVQSYQIGDVIYQDGQAFEFDGKGFVAVDNTASEADTRLDDVLSSLGTPYQAFIDKVDVPSFMGALTRLKQISRIHDVPQWAFDLHNALSEVDEGKRAQQYRLALVGLSVQAIAEKNVGVNKVEKFSELSDAMTEVYRLDTAMKSYKKAFDAIKLHYQSTGTYSDAWKGVSEKQAEVTDVARMIEKRIYQTKSTALPVAEVRSLGINPETDDAWVLIKGGEVAMRADDYFVGNVGDKLAEIQKELETATGDYKVKLMAMLTEAEVRADKINIDNISFNMRSPLVDNAHLSHFLRGKVAGTGLDVQIKQQDNGTYKVELVGNPINDEGRLLKRIGYYILNGTISHGGVKITQDRRELSNTKVLEILRERVNRLNIEFDLYVKSDPVFMKELKDKADDKSQMSFKRADDESELDIDGLSDNVKLHGYQNAFVRKMAREMSGINEFDVGLGKAQPLDAKVLTPSGWVRMGDLKVGDLVVTPSGEHSRISAVYPQGVKDIYQVVFNDGSKTESCDEHLWLTQTEQDRRRIRYAKSIGQELNKGFGTVKQLSEIRETLIDGKRTKNHKIPMVGKIDFDKRDLPVEPYLLGVLIGDGGLTTLYPAVSNPDAHIIARLCQSVFENYGGDVTVNPHKSINRCDTFGLSKRKGLKHNPLTSDLKELGLMGLLSSDKFIPAEYLTASYEQRIALLHGLMDTDGFVSKNGKSVQYYTTSKRLADDLTELVQSLGGTTSCKVRKASYKKNGITVDCKDCYVLSLRVPAHINPFSLPRKADRVVAKTKYQPSRHIAEVNYVGRKEAKCIQIEHEDHLYVTDDYIVTHNTYTALASAQYALNVGTKKKVMFVVPNAVLSNWKKESAKLYATSEHDKCLFIGADYDKDGNMSVSSSNYSRDLNEILSNKHNKIFISMSAFSMIRMREESVDDYIKHLSKYDTALTEVSAAGKNEKKEGIKETLKAMIIDSGSLDNAPFFEDLGIDSIIIDEAHRMKNLKTAFRNSGTRGLAVTSQSKLAVSTAAKAWLVRKGNIREDGVVLLTATPVTNSPLEVYSMSCLAVGEKATHAKLLNAVNGGDSFVEMIAHSEYRTEKSITGDDISVQVLTGLKNVNLITGLKNSISDRKTANDVGFSFKQPDVVDEVSYLSLNQYASRVMQRVKNAYRVARQLQNGTTAAMVPKDMFNDYTELLKLVNGDENLLASPFNAINNMSKILLDTDLYKGKARYMIADAEKGQAIADKFNAGKHKSIMTETPPDDDSLLVRKQMVSKGGFDAVRYYVKPVATYEDGVLELSCDDFDIIGKLDAIIEKETGNDGVKVQISPKVASLLENIKKEQATIKGKDSDGKKFKFAKQIIFVESLALHRKLKRLIASECGIPASRIDFISGRHNGDDEAIIATQERFNGNADDGLSILILNKKGEVGINLQKGTQAIHHLELNWTPDSIHQRNGRGARQGNDNEFITSYFYEVDGTFDKYRRAVIDKKSDWIQRLTGSENGQMVEVSEGMTQRDADELIGVESDEDFAKLHEIQSKRKKDERDALAIDSQNINIGMLMSSREWLKNYGKFEEYLRGAWTKAYGVQQELSGANSRYLVSISKGSSEKTIQKNLNEVERLQSEVYRLAKKLKGISVNVKRGGQDTIYEVVKEVDGQLVVQHAIHSAYNDIYDNSSGILKTQHENEVARNESIKENSTINAKNFSDTDGAIPAEVVQHLYETGIDIRINGRYIPVGSVVKGVRNSGDVYFLLGTHSITEVTTSGTRPYFTSRKYAEYKQLELINDGVVIKPDSAEYAATLKTLADLESDSVNSGYEEPESNYIPSNVIKEIRPYLSIQQVEYISVLANLTGTGLFPRILTGNLKPVGDVGRALREEQAKYLDFEHHMSNNNRVVCKPEYAAIRDKVESNTDFGRDERYNDSVIEYIKSLPSPIGLWEFSIISLVTSERLINQVVTEAFIETVQDKIENSYSESEVAKVFNTELIKQIVKLFNVELPSGFTPNEYTETKQGRLLDIYRKIYLEANKELAGMPIAVMLSGNTWVLNNTAFSSKIEKGIRNAAKAVDGGKEIAWVGKYGSSNSDSDTNFLNSIKVRNSRVDFANKWLVSPEIWGKMKQLLIESGKESALDGVVVTEVFIG